MLYRIKINLLQKPITTIILLVSFTLIISFVYFCISMLHAYLSLNEETRREFGGIISIEVDANYSLSQDMQYGQTDENFEAISSVGVITDEQIEEILKIEEVAGVNTELSTQFTPINFNNSQKYVGENPYEQTYEQELSGLSEEEIIEEGKNISLSGHINVEFSDDFRRGINKLVEGEFPKQGEAIISDVLAQESNLSIGDILEVREKSKEQAQTNTLEVVGIYSTKLQFEILETNTFGSYILSISPYNAVYTNFETINLFTQSSNEIKSIEVYLKSPFDSDIVIEKLEQTSINWKVFDAKDVLETYYSGIVKGLDNFYNSMISIFLISTLGGVILLLIILLSFNNDKEIGVLLNIGEKRGNIVKQKIIEYLIIALIALPIAITLGYFVVNALVEPLNPQEVKAEGAVLIASADAGLDAFKPKLTANFNIIDVLLTSGYALILALASSVIMALKVKKHDTKKFLQSEE